MAPLYVAVIIYNFYIFGNFTKAVQQISGEILLLIGINTHRYIKVEKLIIFPTIINKQFFLYI